MQPDKGLKRELEQAGLPSGGEQPFILSADATRQLGIPCHDCGSRKTIYTIATVDPLAARFFDTGSYCYACLLKRCRRARAIPYPIDLPTLEALQRDMGLNQFSQPTFTT